MVAKSPSEKIQVVGLGDMFSPASCVVCGKGTCQEGYIDLGTFVDFLGNLYLCMPCMYQAAETADCITPIEGDMIKQAIEKLGSDNKALHIKIEGLNERLRIFDDAVGAAVAAQPRTITSPAVGGEVISDASESIAEGGESGEPVTEESVTDEGRNQSELAELRNGSGPIKL